MNGINLWVYLIPIAGLILSLLMWWLYRMGREVQIERARESFRLQRELLQDVFLKAAVATGKPRGLIWKACRFEDDCLFVRERKSRRITALISSIIEFEPIPDGDMVENENAREHRQVTVVLHFRDGKWMSDGRALFNVLPSEAVNLYAKDYAQIKKPAKNFAPNR